MRVRAHVRLLSVRVCESMRVHTCVRLSVCARVRVRVRMDVRGDVVLIGIIRVSLVVHFLVALYVV